MKSIRNYESINSVIPLLLIIGKADGFIEKKKKYLVFDSTDENKKVLKKIHRTFAWYFKKMRLRQQMVIKQVNIEKISWKSNSI